MRKGKLLFMMLMAWLLPTAISAQVNLSEGPYTCGFESETELAGWSVYNIQEYENSSTGVYSQQQHSGSACFGFIYTMNTPQYIISPELSGTENGVEFEFYYKSYSTTYGPETFKVGYSKSSSTVTDDTWVWGDEVTANNTTYQAYKETLPPGVKYVSVQCTSYDKFYFFIDDFTFKAAEAGICWKPTNVSVANITNHSADISWTPANEEQDQWQISFYTDASETPDDGDIVVSGSTTYTLDGLTPETTYYIAVRTACGGDSYSAWTSVSSFTTTARYAAPTDVAASNITDSSADITWTAAADATTYNLRYKEGVDVSQPDAIPDGWTLLDEDGDGNNWITVEYTDGEKAFVSFSYDNSTHMALTPDNWLITPKMTLGGTFTFNARGRDPSYADEHFAVFVSTTTLNASSFTQVSEEFTATDTQTTYTVDLSEYAGQQGYIAIRHFNVSDQFSLMVTDIEYSAGDWTVVNGARNPYPLTGLNPATPYIAEVQSVYGSEGTSAWAGTSFTTINLFAPPTDVVADNVTATSADIDWTVNGIETKWNLRYTPVADIDTESFESGSLNGWTTIDSDGDGNDWGIFPTAEYASNAFGHNSISCMSSASYDNATYRALTPDNWLISPKTALKGTFQFWAKAADASYPDEKFAVFVSTDSNTDVSDFAMVSEQYTATGDWKLYTVDLNSFKGQEGYVAIRHYDCTNMYLLYVDDIAFVEEKEVVWTEVNGVTEHPVALSDLETGTTYRVQVQAVYDDGTTSEWVEGEFTTVAELTLLDNDYEQPADQKNTALLAKYLYKEANVTLSGRTFYKDGNWNTLILPFSLSPNQMAASPLAGAEVQYPGGESTVEGTHVTLKMNTFTDGIVAGYPFFVRWSSGEDITDPTFNGVFIEEAQDPLFPINKDYTIYTIGYYSADMLQPESALPEDEPLIYYLSTDNKLRFTGTPRLMGAFRHGFVFRKTETGALDFTLDFDGDEVTGITEVDGGKVQGAPEGFYNLQGVKLSAQPKQKGVYIQNGKKVIIK